MFYDLNLQRSITNEGLIQFKKLLECCIQEQYHTVGVNKTYSDIILAQKQTNDYKEVQVKLSNGTELTQSESKTLNQLSRVTIQISETKNMQQLSDLNSKILQTYDLVAVRPKNQKIFHSLCIEYDYYDIITFDMGEKIPFMLKRNPVYQAIRKGKFFEISLSSMYDANRKRVCLTNCINLIKATKGQNLIVSSDVYNTLYHRSGYDICSLLVTLGLKKDEAYRCVTQNPKKCVAAAKHRKTYKGTIQVVAASELNKYRRKHLDKISKFQEKVKENQKLMVLQDDKK